jgi:hypothetical protein
VVVEVVPPRMRTSPRFPGEQQRRVPCRASGPMPPGIRLGLPRCRPQSFLEGAMASSQSRHLRSARLERRGWPYNPEAVPGVFMNEDLPAASG